MCKKNGNYSALHWSNECSVSSWHRNMQIIFFSYRKPQRMAILGYTYSPWLPGCTGNTPEVVNSTTRGGGIVNHRGYILCTPQRLWVNLFAAQTTTKMNGIADAARYIANSAQCTKDIPCNVSKYKKCMLQAWLQQIYYAWYLHTMASWTTNTVVEW